MYQTHITITSLANTVQRVQLEPFDSNTHYALKKAKEFYEDIPELTQRSNSTQIQSLLDTIIDYKLIASTKIKTSTLSYEILTKTAPWVISFNNKCSTLKEVDDLLPYYSHINELINENKTDTLNSFLSYITPSQLSDILLIGLLDIS